MTRKIYWEDAYKKELDASVVSVEGQTITFDGTVFYPTGGGQPCDQGSITVSGEKYPVIEAKKDRDDVVHISDRTINARVGDSAHLEIDWRRRYAHMRYHTALHVLDGILEATDAGKSFNASPGAITGGQIYTDRARIDFDLQDFSRGRAQQLVELAQSFINEGHEVIARLLTKEEALSTPNLARTEPGRELLRRLEVIRVIEISGLDMQLDGGTHVSNTKEIGRIALSNFESKGARRKRIEIKLE